MNRVGLLTILIALPLWTQAQTDSLSIRFENETFENVIKLVSATTGYNFSYNSDILDPDKRFTLDVTNRSIDNFMNILLRGTDLQHQILSDQIILN